MNKMLPVYRLEQWTLVEREDDAEHSVSVRGLVHGHPLYEQGEEITTSPLIARFDSVVATASGTKYYLSKPHLENDESQDAFAWRERLLEASGLPQVRNVAELEAKVTGTQPGPQQGMKMTRLIPNPPRTVARKG